MRESRGWLSALHRHNLSATVLTILLGVSISLPTGLVFALPTGGQVEEGEVSVEQTDPNTLHFHVQSDKAVLGFSDFNVASHEVVEFHHHQLTPDSSVLSRVTGGSSSVIAGDRQGGTRGEGADTDVTV